MDKYCEFCVNLRSVVYCKADGAYLCLSCDSKVHLANPLSNRHHRTLICESCKCRPAHIRCFDHNMFMCRRCDHQQHHGSTQHRKRVVNSYVGCPSAQDLGALWGFHLNESTDTNVVESVNQGTEDENTFTVVQQLVGLIKVQMYDDHYTSSMIRHKEQKVIKFKDMDEFSQKSVDGEGLNVDKCSSPFSELDSFVIDESNLHGDLFWQCKSPVQSGQLWCQNMQDLGVCEEPTYCLEDLNIPDIDLTFRNFEELFRADHVASPPKKPRYASRIMSLSSAESSGTKCTDSDTLPAQETSCDSPDHHVYVETKVDEGIMASSKAKKHVQRYTRKAT